MKCTQDWYILSQTYNATLFWLIISWPRASANQIESPNQKVIQSEIEPYFYLCLELAEKQWVFLLKVIRKHEMYGNVPVFDTASHKI